MKLALFETYNTLTWMPGFVLFAKMVPAEVEITLVAIFKTLYYSSLFVYGRLLCDLLVFFADSVLLQDNLSILFVFIFGIIGSLTLQTRIKPLLATKQEVKDIQTVVQIAMAVEQTQTQRMTQNLESLRLRVASIRESRNLALFERRKTED